MLRQCSQAVVNTAGTGSGKSMSSSGNFAPVTEELLEADLPVEGTLPAALNGAYVRNGPNPNMSPVGGHHW